MDCIYRLNFLCNVVLYLGDVNVCVSVCFVSSFFFSSFFFLFLSVSPGFFLFLPILTVPSPFFLVLL